jgi:asparagine synthase (glutamine-hydrolysing)
MLDTQHHRGPDARGTYFSKEVCLGHNRLSIIDLSEQANQPFYSSDKRYILVFNGEIYNYLELKKELQKDYTFATSSDTEVLLCAYQEWGEDCLNRLNGMFAFAIYDTQKEFLFASRDRFGVKPLYYVLHNDQFFFASEIKALFAAGISRVPNDQVWASYLAYGSYGLPEQTFWKDIHQLAGGHSLVYNKGNLSITKWYHFEEAIKKYHKAQSYDTVKSTYKRLLEDSIQLRFRADVPIGFNVSGGLDSSALLALVNQVEKGHNIKAFTFYTGDERYDELSWVNRLLETTQNPLEEVLLRSENVAPLSEEVAAFQDEPYGGVPTIAYAQLFKRAKEDGITVLLDGQGMDEQWAGYDYYTKTTGNTIQGTTKFPFRTDVLSKDFFAKAEKLEYPKPFDNEILNMQYRDLFYTKIPRALRFNDRVSMASSIELREPFLDYRLVEYAFAQPLSYKIKDGVQKYLLRDLVSEYIPDSISFAPKRPLQTPQREWLANELKDWVLQKTDSLKQLDWFDQEELSKELKGYFEGDQESSFHIWQWVNTCMLIS